MSITLTTPPSLNNTLGGSTSVSYDHVVMSPLSFDAVNKTISGTARITASASPKADVVTGTLRIDISKNILVFNIEQLDLIHKSELSPAQIIAVQGMLDDAQASIEAGLVSIGVIDGIQSVGT